MKLVTFHVHKCFRASPPARGRGLKHSNIGYPYFGVQGRPPRGGVD